MRSAAFIALALLAAAAAQAAPAAAPAAKPGPPANHDNNAPINISADKFLADSNAKTGVWSGNVLVAQGDIKMRANTVRLNVVARTTAPTRSTPMAMWWWIRRPPAPRPATRRSMM